MAGATITSTPRLVSSSQNASCCRSSKPTSGCRHPAARKSPVVAGLRVSALHKGAVIDRTPNDTSADGCMRALSVIQGFFPFLARKHTRPSRVVLQYWPGEGSWNVPLPGVLVHQPAYG